MFLPHPRVKVSIVGSLRDREVACSASDRQGSNFESCVWRTVSSQSSHHPQEVLLAQFSLYVHKGGLKPDSFLIYNCKKVAQSAHTALRVLIIKVKLNRGVPFDCFVRLYDNLVWSIINVLQYGEPDPTQLYSYRAHTTKHDASSWVPFSVPLPQLYEGVRA